MGAPGGVLNINRCTRLLEESLVPGKWNNMLASMAEEEMNHSIGGILRVFCRGSNPHRSSGTLIQQVCACSNASDICARTCVDADNISFFDKAGHAHLQTGFGGHLFGDTCGSVAAHGDICLGDQQVYRGR